MSHGSRGPSGGRGLAHRRRTICAPTDIHLQKGVTLVPQEHLVLGGKVRGLHGGEGECAQHLVRWDRGHTSPGLQLAPRLLARGLEFRLQAEGKALERGRARNHGAAAAAIVCKRPGSCAGAVRRHAHGRGPRGWRPRRRRAEWWRRPRAPPRVIGRGRGLEGQGRVEQAVASGPSLRARESHGPRMGARRADIGHGDDAVADPSLALARGPGEHADAHVSIPRRHDVHRKCAMARADNVDGLTRGGFAKPAAHVARAVRLDRGRQPAGMDGHPPHHRLSPAPCAAAFPVGHGRMARCEVGTLACAHEGRQPVPASIPRASTRAHMGHGRHARAKRGGPSMQRSQGLAILHAAGDGSKVGGVVIEGPLPSHPGEKRLRENAIGAEVEQALQAPEARFVEHHRRPAPGEGPPAPTPGPGCAVRGPGHGPGQSGKGQPGPGGRQARLGPVPAEALHGLSKAPRIHVIGADAHGLHNVAEPGVQEGSSVEARAQHGEAVSVEPVDAQPVEHVLRGPAVHCPRVRPLHRVDPGRRWRRGGHSVRTRWAALGVNAPVRGGQTCPRRGGRRCPPTRSRERRRREGTCPGEADRRPRTVLRSLIRPFLRPPALTPRRGSHRGRGRPCALASLELSRRGQGHRPAHGRCGPYLELSQLFLHASDGVALASGIVGALHRRRCRSHALRCVAWAGASHGGYLPLHGVAVTIPWLEARRWVGGEIRRPGHQVAL